MPVTALIALGSNMGERVALLRRAIELLQRRPNLAVVRVSSFYDTEPVGGPADQGRFLNAAAELRTSLPPLELLRALLDVENQLGRVRGERFGPRTIDLDMLLYDDLVLHSPELALPHPRLHERLFVLTPLAEIAGDVRHPALHRTIRDLLEAARATSKEPAPVCLVPNARELTGLKTLVTGATSGIGRAIALEFAAAGADVVIHGRRAPQAEEVATHARSFGVQSHVLLADLQDTTACGQLVERGWSLANGLDVWVNNAGADTLTGPAAGWSFDRKLATLLDVDLKGTMTLSRAVGERMKAAGHGLILNIGWDQAETGMEGDSGQLFAAIKGAIMSFSKCLALTLAPEVRVNCVAPGWIRTAWGETASTPWQTRVNRETPLRRWGTPEDVAATARWLAGPSAAFITGQVMRVNGGAIR
jgi:2-amino-4-hydroxy-6-hydroxymethyldihydropteridine diphosphokinase